MYSAAAPRLRTRSDMLNRQSGISREMAHRLVQAPAGRIESWLTQQMHYHDQELLPDERGEALPARVTVERTHTSTH